MWTFADRLRKARESAGLDQAALGRRFVVVAVGTDTDCGADGRGVVQDGWSKRVLCAGT